MEDVTKKHAGGRKARGGSPAKHRHTVRLNDEEEAALVRAAQLSGRDEAEILRHGGMGEAAILTLVHEPAPPMLAMVPRVEHHPGQDAIMSRGEPRIDGLTPRQPE